MRRLLVMRMLTKPDNQVGVEVGTDSTEAAGAKITELHVPASKTWIMTYWAPASRDMRSVATLAL